MSPPTPRRSADAVERVVAEVGGEALLVIWPALPSWRPEHAEGVLDDLASGCGASVGPVFDGGLYMLALTRALPSLFALPEETWDSPDAMGRVLGAINEAGVAVGLLRAERGLRRPADVRAALADPLLDDELRALLRRLMAAQPLTESRSCSRSWAASSIALWRHSLAR